MLFPILVFYFFSNEEVFKLALEKVKEWKKNNMGCKIFSVAQDEWMGHFIKMACECDKCKALDDSEGSQSASIINFVSKLVREINKDYSDVLIEEEYLIDKNNKGGKFYQDFIGWSKITNRLYIWDYAVNFKNYLLPFPNLRTMVKNIEFYKRKSGNIKDEEYGHTREKISFDESHRDK